MILAATEEHLLALSEMESKLFDHSWTIKQIVSHVESNNPILISVDENNQIKGYLFVSEIVGEWEIFRIAVEPQWRRKGVAQELMSHLESFCNSGDTILLEVKSSNISALNLYKKEGFLENGMRKGYYNDGSDAILMMKKV